MNFSIRLTNSSKVSPSQLIRHTSVQCTPARRHQAMRRIMPPSPDQEVRAAQQLSSSPLQEHHQLPAPRVQQVLLRQRLDTLQPLLRRHPCRPSTALGDLETPAPRMVLQTCRAMGRSCPTMPIHCLLLMKPELLR